MHFRRLSLLAVCCACLVWMAMTPDRSGCHAQTMSVPSDHPVIHVVMSNHFDAGFDGISPEVGFCYNVINRYFNTYIPDAIVTARELRSTSQYRLRYMMEGGSWLIPLFLDCENMMIPGSEHITCPSASEKEHLRDAIRRGDITWHAFPFNGEPEFFDTSLFDAGISLSQDLAREFNVSVPSVLSQRDVPGMTRAVIPRLRAKGVRAVSIGSNTGSAPVGVPRAGLWVDPSSGEEVVLLYHPFGYGGITVSDCVEAPGTNHFLAYAWKGDNKGPPSAEEVAAFYTQLEVEFPNATIIASTLDDFVDILWPIRDRLPRIDPDSEMGDTWIHGIASDPLKSAQFRAVMRERRACLGTGACSADDVHFRRFDQLLFKVGEHTWGLDTKTFLHDNVNWTDSQLEKALEQRLPNYELMIKSWIEQRQYLSHAIRHIPLDSFFRRRLDSAMKASRAPLTPPDPFLEGYRRVEDVSSARIRARASKTDEWELGFDRITGGITYLRLSSMPSLDLASSSHLIGVFSYGSYSYSDFLTYLNDYGTCWPGCTWFEGDFGKPGSDAAHPKHQVTNALLADLFVRSERDSMLSESILIKLQLPDEAFVEYGGMHQIWVRIQFPRLDELNYEPVLHFDLVWFNKTKTRLGESAWFSFLPPQISEDPSGWSISKLGQLINPMSILMNGSSHLHGVDDDGIVYRPTPRSARLVRKNDFVSSSSPWMRIVPWDAPLVSVGLRSAMPVPLGQTPPIDDGFHITLVDNIWTANYPQWYPFVDEDRNSRFRFSFFVHPYSLPRSQFPYSL